MSLPIGGAHSDRHIRIRKKGYHYFLYVQLQHVTQQACFPESTRQFSTWVLTAKPQQPSQPLSHQRPKSTSYPTIPKTLHPTATKIIKQKYAASLSVLLTSSLRFNLWMNKLAPLSRNSGSENECLASREEITEFASQTEMDEWVRGGKSYLLLTDLWGFCVRGGLFISLHFGAYQSACPPTTQRLLTVFRRFF